VEIGTEGITSGFRQAIHDFNTPSTVLRKTSQSPSNLGREDDVKFVGLCEQRGIPITRIGVTDTEPTLEIQKIASWPLAALKAASEATLPELFA
jgi:phosphoribosylformylglycinamidine synthase